MEAGTANNEKGMATPAEPISDRLTKSERGCDWLRPSPLAPQWRPATLSAESVGGDIDVESSVANVRVFISWFQVQTQL